jgi:hypothetical protein
MSEDGINQIIEHIENNFDVNSVCYRGLCVWPLIRMELIQQLAVRDRDRFYKLAGYTKGQCHYVLPVLEQFAELKRYRGVDFMFFSQSAEHVTKINHQFYSVYTDPYIEIARDKHSFVKVEMVCRIKETSPRYIPTVFLKFSKARYDYEFSNNSITNFARLHEIILSISEVDIDEDKIAYRFNYVQQYKQYFLELLSHVQPRTVVLECYYSMVQMGLIWACRELNITSVELQHGNSQGCPYYKNWSRVPSNGYEFLPDIFYVWGRTFWDDIAKVQPAGCTSHRPIIGNNLWLSMVSQKKWLDKDFDGVDENFLESLKQKEKVILVPLAARTTSLSAHLLEAMKRLPEEWLWLIRHHPMRRGDYGQIGEHLRSNGIYNYEFENASRHPLYLLLQYCDHLVTAVSSSCLEGLLYGVPTTFVAPFAYDHFKEHIEMGFFNYVPDSVETLIKFLKQDYDRSKVCRIARYFFEMDELAGRKAFDKIAKLSARRNIRLVPDGSGVRDYNRIGELIFKNDDFPNASRSFLNAITMKPNCTIPTARKLIITWVICIGIKGMYG